MQPTDDSQRFPGRGRTLSGGRTQGVTVDNSDSNLQVRLLDSSNTDHPSDTTATGAGQQFPDGTARY